MKFIPSDYESQIITEETGPYLIFFSCQGIISFLKEIICFPKTHRRGTVTHSAIAWSSG